MTNPDDNALVEAARLAMVNAPISDGVTFQTLMNQLSHALDMPWDEAKWRAQTGTMVRAAITTIRQQEANNAGR